MAQFRNALLAINTTNTVPQRALDCGPGLDGLNHIISPNIPLPLFRVSNMNDITDDMK